MSILSFSVIYCHGSDNRFFLIDESQSHLPSLTDAQRRLLSQLLCDKKTGYVVDGLLLCNQPDFAKNFPFSEAYQCSMRMYNPDGTEAEMCGNGLRCAGRYDMEKNQRDSTRIATCQNILGVTKAENIYANVLGYESEIGPIRWSVDGMQMASPHKEIWQNQPLPILEPILKEKIHFTAVSIPNPHFVGLSTMQLSQKTVVKAWELLSSNGLFPQGINLSIVHKIAHNCIFVMTCERGVGPTHACGTAMAASSVVVAKFSDWVDKTKVIEVYNLGGMVLCDVHSKEAQQKVLITGNASWIEKLTVRVDLQSGELELNTVEEYRQEQSHYQALQDYVLKITP